MELPPALFSDVVEFAHRHAVAMSPEKRQVVRLATSVPIKISRLLQGAMEPPTLAVLRDISPTGIGIIHSEAMFKDDLFIAWLPRANAEAVRVHCMVTHWCTLGKDYFVIGATFDRINVPQST